MSRFFGFDPSAHISREQATVGVLRRRAAESRVDTSETSKAEYRRRYELVIDDHCQWCRWTLSFRGRPRDTGNHA